MTSPMTGMHDGPQPAPALPASDLPGVRPVSVRLVAARSPSDPVAAQEAADCSFWIGTAGRGDATPRELLDQQAVAGILAEAAGRGLSEPTPMVLSDTSIAPARYVCLMPPPGHDFRMRTIWIDDLVRTMRPFAPASVGIFVDPTLVAESGGRVLIQELLASLIRAVPANEYFLMTTEDGHNAVMNAALRLKLEVETDELKLFVFH